MTELSPIATLTPIEEQKSGSCGFLLSNLEMKIVDPDTGKEMGFDQPGEILIKGPTVMKGYVNRREITAETIDKDGYIHSGDIGYVDKNGHLFVIDRCKELIKYKGFQVAPAELEAKLLEHPAIEDVGVIGIKDEMSGELPRAYIVLKEFYKNNTSSNDIIEYINEFVAPHKRLRGGIVFVDSIPKSPSGKILRRILRDQYNQHTKSKL